MSTCTRRMRSIAIAALALAGFAASQQPAAANSCTGTCVTYTASGTFDTTVIKGPDTFKLAGQKFTISITNVPTTTHPFKMGVGWFAYNMLNMSGTVNSGLDPTPIPLVSNSTSMELAIETTKQLDVVSLYVPVKVLGLTFYILANINAPFHTFDKLSIYPFNNPVTLSTSNSAVVYQYTPAGGTLQSTTLSIATGSLITACTGTCGANPVNGGGVGTAKSAALESGSSPDGTPAASVVRAAVAIPVRKQDLAPAYC